MVVPVKVFPSDASANSPIKTTGPLGMGYHIDKMKGTTQARNDVEWCAEQELRAINRIQFNREFGSETVDLSLEDPTSCDESGRFEIHDPDAYTYYQNVMACSDCESKIESDEWEAEMKAAREAEEAVLQQAEG